MWVCVGMSAGVGVSGCVCGCECECVQTPPEGSDAAALGQDPGIHVCAHTLMPWLVLTQAGPFQGRGQDPGLDSG